MTTRSVDIWVQGEDDDTGDEEFFGEMFYDEEAGFPTRIVLRLEDGTQQIYVKQS